MTIEGINSIFADTVSLVLSQGTHSLPELVITNNGDILNMLLKIIMDIIVILALLTVLNEAAL